MLPEALKGSWLNSQGLKSEESQTWNFHFLYTCFQHRKGHSQQNNKLCLPLACETGSDEIKQASKTLKPPCFSAFSLHTWGDTSHTWAQLSDTQLLTQPKLQTSRFQHSTKIHLTRIVKCFWFFTCQPENPRNRDCQCFTDAKNRFYTSGVRKHNGSCKGFYYTTLNWLIKIISCFSNHSSIKTNKMNHWAFPFQRSCMAHSHFAVVLGGESVGNEEHLPCTLPFLLSPHSSSPPPLEIPTM